MKRTRALRDGLAIAGLLFAVYLFAVVAPSTGTFGFDAYAYWHIDIVHPFHAAPDRPFGAFDYTPIAARLFSPFINLSWLTFLWLWLALLVATVIWLGWRRTLLVLAFPPVALELYHGNIHLLMAAAIALGFRYPATWAFVLVTKVTPGVGLLWFVVRREWRSLAIALGVTGVLGVISLLVDGRLWLEWISGSLVPAGSGVNGQPNIAIPLLVRLPLAAVLVAWGARTDRRWTVPASATLALPVLWPAGLSMLVAILAVNRPELLGRDQARGSEPVTAQPR